MGENYVRRVPLTQMLIGWRVSAQVHIRVREARYAVQGPTCLSQTVVDASMVTRPCLSVGNQDDWNRTQE